MYNKNKPLASIAESQYKLAKKLQGIEEYEMPKFYKFDQLKLTQSIASSQKIIEELSGQGGGSGDNKIFTLYFDPNDGGFYESKEAFDHGDSPISIYDEMQHTYSILDIMQRLGVPTTTIINPKTGEQLTVIDCSKPIEKTIIYINDTTYGSNKWFYYNLNVSYGSGIIFGCYNSYNDNSSYIRIYADGVIDWSILK